MAALACDLCGGKLVMGAGGIAVCDSCGMEYTADRMKEKVQEIKGVVRVDNSHMVDNWMKMGASAAQAGNHKEAYEYFTKVIEVDPENWRAIYEKGKAGAWQSTLGNLRTSEIYQGITMALQIIEQSDLNKEELVDIKNEFAVALFNINNAITDLVEENLNNLDDKYLDSHWDQMWNTRQRYITNVSQLEDAMNLIIDLEDELSKSNVIGFKKRICSDLKNACSSVQYWTDYSQSSLGYFGFKTTEKKEYLDKYWKLVDEIREVEPKYATDKWSYPDPFNPGLHMSDECYKYWQKIDAERQAQKEKEVKKKRFDTYWIEHAEEKKCYDARIIEIDSELSSLKNQTNDYDSRVYEIKKELSRLIPAENQLAEIIRQQSELNSQKSKLGLFSSKQKKQIQEQLDILQLQANDIEVAIKHQKKSIQDDVEARIAVVENERKPLMIKIDALESEKKQIHLELTKDR